MVGSYLVDPCCEVSKRFICEPCVYRGRKVEALGGRKRQGIKSPSVCVPLMTDADLGSGLLSLYCSCLKEKHDTVICGSLGDLV